MALRWSSKVPWTDVTLSSTLSLSLSLKLLTVSTPYPPVYLKVAENLLEICHPENIAWIQRLVTQCQSQRHCNRVRLYNEFKDYLRAIHR